MVLERRIRRGQALTPPKVAHGIDVQMAQKDGPPARSVEGMTTHDARLPEHPSRLDWAELAPPDVYKAMIRLDTAANRTLDPTCST